ncbi:HAD family hydrolase [Chitinolyticbacter albus]|uniref:HAD family hydrolase n=1 Tax=Chitinolyticbacter albus TaxID=2961951 RepID=UPI002109FA7C|nr:HAD family hydrolase [Chitinolyticbacter albus]
MPIAAVVFDLDDTLHDKSATLRLFALQQYDRYTLRQHGVNERDWLARYVALHTELLPKPAVFLALGQGFGLPPELVDALATDFDRRLGLHAVPFPGARELVHEARAAGALTALLSNGRDAFQRSKLAGLGLVCAFDVILTSGAAGIKKPATTLFETLFCQLAALRPGLRPAEVAMVGDSLAHDILPARALGWTTLWKSPHTDPHADFSSPQLLQIRHHLIALIRTTTPQEYRYG